MMNLEHLKAAEESVRNEAAEIAYKLSEGISDPKLQRKEYDCIFTLIRMGAKMLGSELLKLENELLKLENEELRKRIKKKNEKNA